jgi:hypothetical protein
MRCDHNHHTHRKWAENGVKSKVLNCKQLGVLVKSLAPPIDPMDGIIIFHHQFPGHGLEWQSKHTFIWMSWIGWWCDETWMWHGWDNALTLCLCGYDERVPIISNWMELLVKAWGVVFWVDVNTFDNMSWCSNWMHHLFSSSIHFHSIPKAQSRTQSWEK